MRKNPPIKVTAAMGTLTRKIDPHQKCSGQPPVTGPGAMPRPATPVQTAMARVRCAPEKMLLMIDRVEGIQDRPVPRPGRQPRRKRPHPIPPISC
ncbi:MAG: hypothetical protein M3Y33_05685 [Actinomycetota bacterium]|nr:hypothetical protein [Actinomycetota bacterium]